MDMAGCLRCDREVKTGSVIEDKVIYTYCSRRCYDLDARRGSYSAAGSTTVPALLRDNMAGQPPYAMPLSDAQLRSLSVPHAFIPNAGMGSMTTTPALSNSLSLASVSTYPQSVPSIPLPHSPSSTKSSNLLFHRRPSISSGTPGMTPVARAPASAPPYLAPHTQVTYHRANRSHHSPILNSSTPANSFAPHHMDHSSPRYPLSAYNTVPTHPPRDTSTSPSPPPPTSAQHSPRPPPYRPQTPSQPRAPTPGPRSSAPPAFLQMHNSPHLLSGSGGSLLPAGWTKAIVLPRNPARRLWLIFFHTACGSASGRMHFALGTTNISAKGWMALSTRNRARREPTHYSATSANSLEPEHAIPPAGLWSERAFAQLVHPRWRLPSVGFLRSRGTQSRKRATWRACIGGTRNTITIALRSAEGGGARHEAGREYTRTNVLPVPSTALKEGFGPYFRYNLSRLTLSGDRIFDIILHRLTRFGDRIFGIICIG